MNKLVDSPEGFVEECRRYPPQTEGWPETSFTDWCGEWQRSTYFTEALLKEGASS